MNKYPLWKYLLILVVLAIGTLYAIPNIYPEQPAVQVSSTASDIKLTDDTLERVKGVLADAGIETTAIGMDEQRIIARFTDTEIQLKARDLLKDELGRAYAVALNLVATTPDWLRALNALPMYLGLDLRGGVYFLMEVDMDAAVRLAEERYVSDIRSTLRDEKIRYLTVNRRSATEERPTSGVEIKFRDAQTRDEGMALLKTELRALDYAPSERDGAFYIFAAMTLDELRETKRFALQQNLATLRNRVNELGVAEPIIQQQGEERIVVQLPGVQDPVFARDILGATATLEYHAQDYEGDVQAALQGRVPPGSRLYYERNGRPVLLKKRIIVTGDQITNAASGIDTRSGSPMVSVTLDDAGARRMLKFTRENVGKPMAVVYIETKTVTKNVDGKEVRTRQKIEEVISIANVLEPFGKRFQTTGLDSPAEARQLSLLLRAGSLAAPVDIVEERTIGPSLGKDNIDQGTRSVIFGFIFVLAFMAFWYRGFGLVANTALLVNLVLIVAVLSMLQATLTLPGIAGIVLTVGMAVDANVLIFERIREELRIGNTPQASISAGYAKALSTISDANITTLIAAIVLFTFGTGPVKGFAITLSIGIVTSMFTAIMGTRAIVNLAWGSRRLKGLSIGVSLVKKISQWKFMQWRKLTIVISAILMLVSIGSLATRGLNFGVDFTGGTVIEAGYEGPVELAPVREALASAGFRDAQVQHFGTARDVLIRIAPREGVSSVDLSAQIMDTLTAAYSGTVERRRVESVGPQVGEELTEQGGLAMIYALGFILVYVALRFEKRFAVGSVAALVHDVVIVLGFFSLLQLEFDLTVLAAILAVIGYSLNDTIVVFDRIRENFLKLRKKSSVDVVNISINETLSRTMITSLTTLLVLVALFVIGGELIHNFAIALIVGIFVGTYSSIYVASSAALALGISKTDLMPVEKEGVDELP
ncbi:MAG: protein translocase subunit SecD [Granulosicoccaceae bacterium]|jgi:protein-export membrane protein SecD/preprotein translocase SecF subunit